MNLSNEFSMRELFEFCADCEVHNDWCSCFYDGNDACDLKALWDSNNTKITYSDIIQDLGFLGKSDPFEIIIFEIDKKLLDNVI